MPHKCENISGVCAPLVWFITTCTNTWCHGESHQYTSVIFNWQHAKFPPLFPLKHRHVWGLAVLILIFKEPTMKQRISEAFCRWKLLICIYFSLITCKDACPFMRPRLSYLQELTLAGVWIQMAALNRMWSHSCFSSGAPCVRPSRYFAKERNCSNTALVMCTRDDCRWKHKVMFNNNQSLFCYKCVFILPALWRAKPYGNCSENVSLQYPLIEKT